MPALSNPRWERFCHEFICDLNASQAYLRAGYKGKANAHDHGARLKAKPVILARIAELKQVRSKRLRVTQDRVIQELCRIAFSDLREVAEWGPTNVSLKASSELQPEVTAAIRKVRLTQEGLYIEMHDKVSALLKLAEHLGMVSKIKLSGDLEASQVKMLVVRSLDEIPISSPALTCRVGA